MENFKWEKYPGSVPRVSLNPLVDFISASEARKKTIVKQQKMPSKVQIALYRTARSTFKKYIQGNFDRQIVENAIDRLQHREIRSKWGENDVINSITALRKFITFNFPGEFGKIRCSFSEIKIKQIVFNNLYIIIAPDLIFRWEVDGIHYVGAVKFRIIKRKIDYSNGAKAASLLSYYLKHYVATDDEIINNQYCWYVDVMNERIFNAASNIKSDMLAFKKICSEYIALWINVA